MRLLAAEDLWSAGSGSDGMEGGDSLLVVDPGLIWADQVDDEGSSERGAEGGARDKRAGVEGGGNIWGCEMNVDEGRRADAAGGA